WCRVVGRRAVADCRDVGRRQFRSMHPRSRLHDLRQEIRHRPHVRRNHYRLSCRAALLELLVEAGFSGQRSGRAQRDGDGGVAGFGREVAPSKSTLRRTVQRPMVMEDAMVENRLSQNQKPTGGTPYRLAAISLFIVATLVAVIVFDYGAADYNPHAPVCLQG